MESIPEDEEIENGRQNPNLNPYTKARRRDSVCSSNSSSGQDSDSEQVCTVRESLTKITHMKMESTGEICHTLSEMSNLATDCAIFLLQRFTTQVQK